MKTRLTKIQTTRRYFLSHHSAQLIVVSFVIVIGGLVVVGSHAATSTTSLEAESGTLSGSASAVNDPNASSGHAVQFGSTQFAACPSGWSVCPNVPAAPPSLRTNCQAQPSSCGFADTTNAGIQTGAILTKVPSQATSGSGWSYNGGGVTITGNVGSSTTGLELADGVTATINGSNVTIQNLKLDGVHGQSSEGVVIEPTSNNVTVSHCDIAGAPYGSPTDSNGYPYSTARGWAAMYIPSGGSSGETASNVTVEYCDMHGFSGPIFPFYATGHYTFLGNYLHYITYCPTSGSGACDEPDHCNDFGDNRGPVDTTSTMLLMNNTMYGDGACMSTTISFFPDGAAQTNQHAFVYHNLISDAGYYCINPGRGDAFGSAGFSYLGSMYNDFIAPATFPNPPQTETYPACGGSGNYYGGNISNAANFNFQCGNYFDNGPFIGTGADSLTGDYANWYPQSYVNPTSCP